MILASIRSRLVADWSEATKWWSVRWNALGAILLPLMTMVPDMPDSVRDMFPVGIRAIIAGMWCVVSIGFRVWAQRKPNA